MEPREEDGDHRKFRRRKDDEKDAWKDAQENGGKAWEIGSMRWKDGGEGWMLFYYTCKSRPFTVYSAHGNLNAVRESMSVLYKCTL